LHNSQNLKTNVYFLFWGVVFSGISLFVLEISTRFLDLAPPVLQEHSRYVSDRHLPFKPKPFSIISGRSSTGEFNYTYRHNSFGFRDVEHSRENHDDVYRILGLGDSFTYGAGVQFEETYLYQLERMLSMRDETHRKVEIIKAGIPRYYPKPERILLEKYGVNYSPDLIIIGFLPNDVINTYYGIDYLEVDNSGYLRSDEGKNVGVIGTWLYKQSYFFRVLFKEYISYKNSKKYQPEWGDINKSNGFHEKEWVKIENEFRKIISIARKIDSRVIFVHIPQKGPWNDSHYYPSKRLSKLTKNNNAEFLDILPAMIKASKHKSLYYENDGHCTPAGHKIIAGEIFDYIVKNIQYKNE